MESSITTFNGLRCTRVSRTIFLTATSTSAASETAGQNLSSIGTSTATYESSVTSSSISSGSQTTDLASTTSATTLVATAISASSTITAAASVLPAVTSSNTNPVSTQISGNSLGGSTTDDSKKHVIAVAIGVSLGAVVLVALIVLFAYLRRRKRSRQLPVSSTRGGLIPRGTCGCGITGLLPSLADIVSKIKQKLTNKAITKLRTKVQAVVARIWKHGSTTKDKRNDKSVETQAEIIEKGVTREALSQTPTESKNNNISSSPPRKVPHLANPFFNPPKSNNNKSSSWPENQPNNPTEPHTPANDSDQVSISLPLTVRNVVESDSDDNHSKKNVPTNRQRKNSQSRYSGSTLTLSSGRGSSPLIPDFKSRLENWRRDLKSADRTSAHSDPFDLERPLTAHSSPHPTPMAEQQKFREGYF
ncbi:hypothetical protein UA08_04432 [Talaromyces atroroseus]|uniref:Mid2 domain-containing protein n=1 Tax=Talaromyces atroroseus TaxID=1441469 RepID=A0A1Q5Q8M5_TALAT|nr:hypothetical protein UA08_04432 [Talaromyces atroroseus]OKL60488.1 hypothetical protein UA08_04432 [Talaromyces atroroseus]